MPLEAVRVERRIVRPGHQPDHRKARRIAAAPQRHLREDLEHCSGHDGDFLERHVERRQPLNENTAGLEAFADRAKMLDRVEAPDSCPVAQEDVADDHVEGLVRGVEEVAAVLDEHLGAGIVEQAEQLGLEVLATHVHHVGIELADNHALDGQRQRRAGRDPRPHTEEEDRMRPGMQPEREPGLHSQVPRRLSRAEAVRVVDLDQQVTVAFDDGDRPLAALAKLEGPLVLDRKSVV